MIGLALAGVAIVGLSLHDDDQEQHMRAAGSLAYVAASGTAGSQSASLNFSLTTLESLYPNRVTMEEPPSKVAIVTALPPPGANREIMVPLPGRLYSG